MARNSKAPVQVSIANLKAIVWVLGLHYAWYATVNCTPHSMIFIATIAERQTAVCTCTMDQR